MNPINWLKLGVIFVIIFLVGSLATMTNLYLGKRDELIEYRSEVRALAQQAKIEAEQTKQLHQETLKQVRKDYEDRVPQIRNDAVAAYRASIRVRVQPKPSSSGVPTPSPSVQVDDGASAQCVLDDQFIRDAAEDAAKVEAWREYCFRNKCPVE